MSDPRDVKNPISKSGVGSGSRPGDAPTLAASNPAPNSPNSPSHADLAARRSLEQLLQMLSPRIDDDELGWLAHYRVLRVLGQGGMGVVFEAEDTHLQRKVALKVMLPELAELDASRDRFLREARAVAQLRNDHVVSIYQIGQENGLPFFAMEFLQGGNLQDLLDTGAALPIPQILRISREIAQGLAAAHEVEFIHRDIKPANVWIEETTRRVRILDFGLARPQQADGSLTQTGNIVGTPYYMSPEQARGDHIDCRTDLFSLGVVMFELCTRQLPFEGKDLFSFLSALATKPPRNIVLINPDVPQPLVDLIERLLAKNPDERLTTAQEVVDALRQIEKMISIPGGITGEQRVTLTMPAANTSVRGDVQTDKPISSLPPTPKHSAWPTVFAGSVALVALIALLWMMRGRFLDEPTEPDGSGPVNPVAVVPTPKTPPSGPPVLVGVLHSRTGTMAISERPVIDAVLLAIEEVNQQGGVLGRPLKALVEDGQSDEQVFAARAEKLLTQDKVATIFGCWTSASRKAVKPVVEKHNGLLVYPVSYEGMEASKNIIYGGAVPNQQILPALKWSSGFLSPPARKWFLVGSDYVFPHAANEVIKDEARELGCTILGEEYALLGDTNLADIVAKIKKAQPDLILNTLNGDSNIAFLRSLRAAGIYPKDIPTLSFSISQQEVSAFRPKEIAGDFVAGNYLQDIDRPENHEFLKRFKKRYGQEVDVSDAMQTAYYGVLLWAAAANDAKSLDITKLRDSIRGRRFDAPQGIVVIDAENQHTTQKVQIGRFTASGEIEEVYVTPRAVVPEPFPPSRTPQQWTAFLDQLYHQWGNRWANPGR